MDIKDGVGPDKSSRLPEPLTQLEPLGPSGGEASAVRIALVVSTRAAELVGALQGALAAAADGGLALTVGLGSMSFPVLVEGAQLSSNDDEWLDADVIDSIALLLGSSDGWEPDHLERIADFCGRVREHPGDPEGGGAAYLRRFSTRAYPSRRQPQGV